MDVVYARESFPKTVVKTLFLAGPSPRAQHVRSWRQDALAVLERLGYDGTVFVPERRNGTSSDYLAQVDWEDAALARADQIVFWVPRDLTTMPGFSTNHEHGEWFASGKVVLGFPPDAPKTRYLAAKAKAAGDVPICTTLEATLTEALRRIGDGSPRREGECSIPLLVWRTPSFQQWYGAQTNVGNTLRNARVLWTFRVGEARARVFLWALHADVYVAAERRHKRNEIVIGRSDVAHTVLYRRGRTLLDTLVVLVREFRSAATTTDGFIHELPGGSSWDAVLPKTVAVEEVIQETGFPPEATRLVPRGTRQLAGTLLSHAAHAFAYELTDAELAAIRARVVQTSPADDDEHTVVEIQSVRDLLTSGNTDWSTLGMVLAALVPLFP